MDIRKALKLWPHAEPKELVRFAEKVTRQASCMVWTAQINKGGYGVMQVKRDGKFQPRMAHQLSYEWNRGKPAPKRFSGFCLDHKPKCKNRACVNPAHIRKVRNRVNVVDNSYGLTGNNARKTHCPRNHPYSPENTYVTPSGFRQCRKCNYERVKARREAGKR